MLKKDIISKLREWRRHELEDIIKNEVFEKDNNVKCNAVEFGKGFVCAIEMILREMYDFNIKE